MALGAINQLVWFRVGLGIIAVIGMPPHHRVGTLGQITTITLAACGLEELFCQVVLLCQFFVPVGNRFWFYILTYVT
jgi:hypothetical protein